MTKTTPTIIQFSFDAIFFFHLLVLLVTHANSLLNDKEKTVLLKLKQHRENPRSLSHWTSLKQTRPTVTGQRSFVSVEQSPNCYFKTRTSPKKSHPSSVTSRTSVIYLSNNFISQEFPKAPTTVPSLKTLTSHRITSTAQSQLTFTACLACATSTLEPTTSMVTFQHGQLTELRTLQLFLCAFNGSFPPEIGNLFKLEPLQLAYNVNMTAAELPSSFMELKKLKFLRITASNLNGEIPDTVGEMEALVQLDLSINNLTGKIPSSLFMPKN